MTTSRPGQFRVDMPDGLVIERLPVGLAHGSWRLSFVVSGVSFLAGDPPRALDFREEFRDRVTVEGIGRPLTSRGGGGRGGDAEQEISLTYLDDGVTGVRITYTYEGETVASEVVDLAR